LAEILNAIVDFDVIQRPNVHKEDEEVVFDIVFDIVGYSEELSRTFWRFQEGDLESRSFVWLNVNFGTFHFNDILQLFLKYFESQRQADFDGNTGNALGEFSFIRITVDEFGRAQKNVSCSMEVQGNTFQRVDSYVFE